MGHDVHVALCVSATVSADFVDGVIDSFSVSCQLSVMPTTKHAKLYSVRTWKCVFLVMYFAGASR